MKSKIFRFFIAFILISNSLFAQSGTVKVNGITIAYESFGNVKKDAIILIQGTGATLEHYPIELCEKLAKNGHRVIRFDNRDIGLSSKLDSLGQPDWGAIYPFFKTCNKVPLPYTLLDMGKDVIGLMDALKIKKAHIVGTSMGGAIAQLIAINYPNRLLTLTSISASSGNPNREEGNPEALKALGTPPPTSTNNDSIAKYLVKTYRALGALDTESVLLTRAHRHINRSWYPDGTNRQVAAVFIGDYCDRREDLAKIKIPSLIIHGDKDPIVPLSAGKEVGETIPNSKLYIIKGMGHDISLAFVNELVAEISKTVKSKKN